MIAVANDNVTNTNGDADAARTLDLRAANLNGVAVPDVVLDRRSQPGRTPL